MAFDEAARKTMTKCLFTLCQTVRPLDAGSMILIFLQTKGYLNDAEVEDIVNAGPTSVPRVKALVTYLKSKMTTDLFRDFLFAINSYNIGNYPGLAKQLLETYQTCGGARLSIPRPSSSLPRDKVDAPARAPYPVENRARPAQAVTAPATSVSEESSSGGGHLPVSAGRMMECKAASEESRGWDVMDSATGAAQQEEGQPTAEIQFSSAEEPGDTISRFQPRPDDPPPIRPIILPFTDRLANVLFTFNKDKEVVLFAEPNLLVIVSARSGDPMRIVQMPTEETYDSSHDLILPFCNGNKAFILCSSSKKSIVLFQSANSASGMKTWTNSVGKQREVPVFQSSVVPGCDSLNDLKQLETKDIVSFHGFSTEYSSVIVVMTKDSPLCYKVDTDMKIISHGEAPGAFTNFCSCLFDNSIPLVGWNCDSDDQSPKVGSFENEMFNMEDELDFAEKILLCVIDPKSKDDNGKLFLYIYTSENELLRFDAYAIDDAIDDSVARLDSSIPGIKELVYDKNKNCLVGCTTHGLLQFEEEEGKLTKKSIPLQEQQGVERRQLIETCYGMKVISFYNNRRYYIQSVFKDSN